MAIAEFSDGCRYDVIVNDKYEYCTLSNLLKCTLLTAIKTVKIHKGNTTMFGRKRTNVSTYLSATSEFQGNLNVEGDLRVDGIIHGTVEVKGNIEVSQTGLVEGPELKAHNITVHGVIKARIVAEGRLTLTRTARLEGDVTANSLDIEAGAVYVGYIATTDVKALPGSSNYPELMSERNPPPI
jgi:cytoskeletal protein CcmA (bactofilin family)